MIFDPLKDKGTVKLRIMKYIELIGILLEAEYIRYNPE